MAEEHRIERVGGVEWGPEQEGQTHGLYIFDPEHPAQDHKGRPVFAVRLHDDVPACGSKKQSKPGYCESPYRMVNGRCKLHGGKALKGLAHPNAKDLKRSRFQPRGKLLEKFEAARNDPELTHHRETAALLDTLTDEVLANWEEGGTPQQWRDLNRLWETFRVAWNVKDWPRLREAMEEITLVMERGVNQSEREIRILRLQSEARKARTAETNRKLAESMTFTLPEAEFFYTQLGHSVRRHLLNENISREEALRRVQDDMAGIAGQSGVG